MAVSKEMWQTLIAFAIVMGSTVFFIAWLQPGFFWPFWRVKMSRGARILVGVHTPVRKYYRAGEVAEGFLLYNDQKGETHRLAVRDGVFYKTANVLACDVDEMKNTFLRPSGGEVTGYDAVKFDGLIKRALLKPMERSNLEKIILALLVVLLLGLVVLGVFAYRHETFLKALKLGLDTLTQGQGSVI